MPTAHHAISFHLIRIGYHFQGMPFVARLTSAFLATGFAQAVMTRLIQTFTRWRFAAVPAAFGNLVSESLYLSC
jgi:hypothetical protein